MSAATVKTGKLPNRIYRAVVIRTERLLLRRWRDADRAPFAAMNADPDVVEHLQGPMSRERSDDFIDRIEAHWDAHGRGGKLVMSFHGVPKRTLMLGDPYYCECQKTARLLASRLRLAPDEYVVTFQSRFGKAEWLQPYTAPTVQALAREGVARVAEIGGGGRR